MIRLTKVTREREGREKERGRLEKRLHLGTLSLYGHKSTDKEPCEGDVLRSPRISRIRSGRVERVASKKTNYNYKKMLLKDVERPK